MLQLDCADRKLQWAWHGKPCTLSAAIETQASTFAGRCCIFRKPGLLRAAAGAGLLANQGDSVFLEVCKHLSTQGRLHDTDIAETVGYRPGRRSSLLLTCIVGGYAAAACAKGGNIRPCSGGECSCDVRGAHAKLRRRTLVWLSTFSMLPRCGQGRRMTSWWPKG